MAVGCGGGATDEPPPAAPELPAAVGESFATQADEIAGLLADGDVAAARARALELRDAIVQAVAEGDVPTALEEKLLAGVNRLIDSIPVEEEPPAEEAPGEEDEDKGKDEDKQKDEDKGKDGDKQKDENKEKDKGGGGDDEDLEDEATPDLDEVTTTVG
ncbi:MAG: hypothetical protein KY396_08565 [Actinobacteria bacterium]|nr:hypothetical protein [Actinomycetota bacterium]